MSIAQIAGRALLIAAITVDCACKHADRSIVSDRPLVSSLRLSCAAEDPELVCRALVESTDGLTPESTVTDVTQTATWRASDDAVLVRQGRVSASRAGVAIVSASAVWSGRSVSASVQLVVDGLHAIPEMTYRLDGAVRDFGNVGLGDARVSIIDKGGGRRDAVTTDSDGSFTAAGLRAGEYALSVSKAGYRSAGKMISLPTDRPVTVALIREPTP